MEPCNRPSGKLTFNVFAARCPSRETFDSIFSKWGMLVLMRLSEGALRFGELRRAVDGISERMLSHTLKTLEKEGMVLRREWQEKPLRVEYSLTDSGRNIAQSMNQVVQVMYSELLEKFKTGPRP